MGQDYLFLSEGEGGERKKNEYIEKREIRSGGSSIPLLRGRGKTSSG